MSQDTPDNGVPFYGDSMPELNIAAFSVMPAFFLSGLTPEQISAKSQIYRTAYEKAREMVSRKASDRLWLETNGLTFGDGI